ncbi:MAG: c-type cytochrome [Bacteroidia bacterium]
MNLRPRHIFFILSFSFLIYSLLIYVHPSGEKEINFNIKKASEGRIVWQKYNCQSCHQLYGLGGYLGPDLTNIYSNPTKGEAVIRALIKSGVMQMPACNISEFELDKLVEFLKSVDASGKSDPRNFNITPTGMIERNEKK